MASAKNLHDLGEVEVTSGAGALDLTHRLDLAVLEAVEREPTGVTGLRAHGEGAGVEALRVERTDLLHALGHDHLLGLTLHVDHHGLELLHGARALGHGGLRVLGRDGRNRPFARVAATLLQDGERLDQIADHTGLLVVRGDRDAEGTVAENHPLVTRDRDADAPVARVGVADDRPASRDTRATLLAFGARAFAARLFFGSLGGALCLCRLIRLGVRLRTCLFERTEHVRFALRPVRSEAELLGDCLLEEYELLELPAADELAADLLHVRQVADRQDRIQLETRGEHDDEFIVPCRQRREATVARVIALEGPPLDAVLLDLGRQVLGVNRRVGREEQVQFEPFPLGLAHVEAFDLGFALDRVHLLSFLASHKTKVH